ncbi:MAG: hypothetical protein B7Z22_10235, partial [Hyphomonas sp. 32-62-5]
ATFRAAAIDVLVAIGGGKVIDAAKCIARRINVPLIVCPTLASTDAPCSAAAVVYTAEGAFRDVEFLPSNPDLVVVDTAIIAKAPVRFLLAGMADALATGYEARTCVANAAARSMVGGRITIAAATIAALAKALLHAAHLLFKVWLIFFLAGILFARPVPGRASLPAAITVA